MSLVRTILTSENNKLTLELPYDMVGKTIECIAFEIEQAKPVVRITNGKKISKAEDLNNALAKYRIDLSAFKFDRDEANDYE